MNIYSEESELEEISLVLSDAGFDSKILLKVQCADGGIGDYLLQFISDSNMEWIAVLYAYLKHKKKKFKLHKNGVDIEVENISKDEFVDIVKSTEELFVEPKKKSKKNKNGK